MFIHRARTRELPDHYPFVVQQTFIDAVIKKWSSPAMDLCKAVHKVIFEHTQKLVKKHFASFGQGYLEQRVRLSLSYFYDESAHAHTNISVSCI